MRLVFFALLATACGGLRSPMDGGAVGGGNTSGTGGGTSSTGGGTASTGGGTSGTGGGTSGTGGGTGTGGGASAVFHYASISIPSTVGSFIAGISGRPGEIYAVSDSNGLFRSTGGGFTEIVLSTSLGTGKGVYVASDGSVFPVGQRQLGACRSNCSVGSSYTLTATTSTVDVMAVCGDSATNVYAPLETVSYTTELWHYDGNGWTKVAGNLGIDNPRGCAMLPDHSVIVAGEKNVAIHLNGVTTVEHPATIPPLTQNEADFHQWYGVGAVGTKVFAVGLSRRISMRTGVDAWTMTTFAGASYALYAVGGPNESEVFAGGSYEGNTTLRLWNGTNWSNAPDLPTLHSVRSMYVAGPNEIYFGGSDTNGDPGVDKASR